MSARTRLSVFTRRVHRRAARLQLPGAGGGVNWGGVAADPTRGLLFFHANDSSLVGWIEAKKPGENYGNNTEGSTIPYDRGSVDGPGPYCVVHRARHERGR